jgi:hypothetical protein
MLQASSSSDDSPAEVPRSEAMLSSATGILERVRYRERFTTYSGP